MRRVLMYVIVSVQCFSAFAQESEKSKIRFYRHEVNVSIGGINVRSGWSDDYERDVMDRFGLVSGISGDSYSGSRVWYDWDETPRLFNNSLFMAVSYYYHFTPHIAISYPR
ncbi:MAG: hypothetical protein IJ544_07675 [Prevotella sp.]|nr:hypothetical protein [Prevotella sp.]